MKTSLVRAIRSVALASALLTVGAASAFAQAAAPAPANSPVTAVSILHLNIANLDKSLAFYRDLLGMEVTAAPAAPAANPGLVSEPGAKMRRAILKVPGGTFSMELVEWSGTPVKPVQARIQDPGAVMIAMGVRDLDAKLAAVRKMPGLKVLSHNQEPFVNTGRDGAKNRAVMIRDEDGIVVEFTDTTNVSPNAWPGAITNVGIFFTANDLEQTVRFYNSAFGLAIPTPMPAGPTTERVKALFDNQGLATMRTARVAFPGTDFAVTFQEFAVAGRKPARHRVQDPGGPIVLVTVKAMAPVLDAIKANGGILGDGETSVAVPADARGAWTRDPNGVLLRIGLPPQPRAGGPAPTTNQ